jgi:hypothetical protein
MENQKIQQLIRLASIADKNGDYKIADKLFEKIAALPPEIPRFKIKPIMGEILKQISELAKLKPLVETVEQINGIAKLMPDSVKTITFVDLHPLYGEFKKLRELKRKSNPTADEKYKIGQLENKFTGDKENLLRLFNYIDNYKFDFDALYQRHRDAPAGTPFSKSTFADVIGAYYKEIAEELRKIDPAQLNSLAPQDKALIDILKAKLKLYQKGEEATVTKLLQPGTEQVTRTTTNNPNALQRFFGVATVTEQKVFETERLPTWTKIINLATTPGRKFSEALEKYNTIKSINAIHALSPQQKKQLEQEAKKAANAAASTAKIGQAVEMISAIPKLIENYDKKFLKSILDAEIVIKADPKTKTFDLSKPADFNKALEMSRQVFQNSEERLLLEGVILQITTIFRREIQVAKSSLRKRGYDVFDATTLLGEISRNNKGMVENLGIDSTGLESLISRIEKNEQIPLEEFLEMQIKILPRMKQVMHPGLKLFLGLSVPSAAGAYYFKIVSDKKKADQVAKQRNSPEGIRQQKVKQIQERLNNTNSDLELNNLAKDLD